MFNRQINKLTFSVVLFLVISFLNIQSSYCANRLFYENYDDTPSEQFTLAGVIANSNFDHIGRTNGQGYDGDHAIVQINYDGGPGYCHRVNNGNGGSDLQDQWEDVGESTSGEHYISYWYRLGQEYDIDPPGYCHKNVRFWHSADSNMSDICMEMHLYGTGAMEFCPTVNGLNQGNIGVPGNYWNTSWHHVEIWIKYDNPASASNGELKCWIDSVLVTNVTGKNFVKDAYPSYTRFSLPSNKSQSTDPDYYFIDEVEIWDGMPSTDTTPPAKPEGLMIIE